MSDKQGIYRMDEEGEIHRGIIESQRSRWLPIEEAPLDEEIIGLMDSGKVSRLKYSKNLGGWNNLGAGGVDFDSGDIIINAAPKWFIPMPKEKIYVLKKENQS